MIKTWLWLEDQPSTTHDFKVELERQNIHIEHFQTITKLTNFLIEHKENLSEYGLILDVLIMGAKYITVPKKWTNQDKDAFYQTDSGYDASLVFCEKFIFNLGIEKKEYLPWFPPPPIIFLTVISLKSEAIISRIEMMKAKWAEENKVSKNDVKIKWIEKWNAMEEVLITTIKEMEN